jgi:predicted DNA binding CopG/RHH family protein
MKNLKILTFGILLVGMASCKKDVDQQLQNGANQQLQQDALAQNKGKLFEKSITIYNADKTNSTTLRFRAASKEQLDKMPLANLEFTLVKTPESSTNATDVTASNIAGDEGYSASSRKDAAQNTNARQGAPEDAIQVDLPFESKTESVSIQVKSKDLNKQQASPSTLSYKFYYISGYHRIKVTNYSYKPIYVYFYKYNGGWIYSGYSYELFQNTYAYYSNCTRTVGAEVDYPYTHNYVVNFYRSCL